LKRIGVFVRSLARRRWRTALLAVILCLTLTASGGWIYYRSLNARMRRDDGWYFPMAADDEPEETGHASETDLGHVDEARLERALKEWAGDPDAEIREDRSVLNILLCGVDTQTGDARGGRADAVLLVSINKRKRTVTLTSILRDSYCYIDLSRDPGNPRAELGRVASAYSLGGPATLMETLSAAYRIRIDDYVCVDLNSFPRLIDALGGVTLDVRPDEADYINRTVAGMKGRFPRGADVKLTGQQALIYSRVSPGSDETRAARQQRLILAILDSARQSSPGQILKALEKVPRYVSTDLTEEDVDTLVKDAFMQGWLSYSAAQLRTPVLPGEAEEATGLSAVVGGRRVWIVDYPQEAKRLQEAIYGRTDVEDSGEAAYLTELFG